MTQRKAPPLGPIHRGGVALPFLNRDIRMTICEPDLVGRVAEALRLLPSDPIVNPALDHFVASTFAAKLKPFTPGLDDPIEWVAAELTRSIQVGILIDQVPEFERLTDKQKLAQLDKLDAAIVQLDEAFGQLRRETWNEVIAAKPDLPAEPTAVRLGIYNLWRGLHEAVRESRRRLRASSSDRGPRSNGPAARAAYETATVYMILTGKAPTVYWDDAAGEHKGEFLQFLTEMFDIFGIEGDPAHYAKGARRWRLSRNG